MVTITFTSPLKPFAEAVYLPSRYFWGLSGSSGSFVGDGFLDGFFVGDGADVGVGKTVAAGVGVTCWLFPSAAAWERAF